MVGYTPKCNMSKTLPSITKGLRYSVLTKIVNFDPKKYTPRTVIVDGRIAIRIKGNVYTKM